VTREDALTVDGMKWRLVVSSLAIAAAAATPLTGCGSSGTAKAPTSSGGSLSASAGSAVTIANFAFSAATLTVGGGARVTVRNDDSTAHTFTADDGHSFDTGSIDPGSSSTVRATEARAVRLPLLDSPIHARHARRALSTRQGEP
jgi:plastocyanin